MSLEQKIKSLIESAEIDASIPDEEITEEKAEQKETTMPVMTNHIDALSEGEALSEEFKLKAATILEAAINDGVKKQLDTLEEQHEQQLDEAVIAVRTDLVEQIDKFLDIMVNEWVEENKLAIEHGIKLEKMENFVDGLKTLFKENYVEVPEEKLDILDEQSHKIDSLILQLDEAVMKTHQLEEAVKYAKIDQIQESVGKSLTVSEFEKFETLCEGIEFTTEEAFEVKLQTIKENYFPKTKRDSVITEHDTPVPQNLVEGAMAHYVQALTNPLAFTR